MVKREENYVPSNQATVRKNRYSNIHGPNGKKKTLYKQIQNQLTSSTLDKTNRYEWNHI